MGDKDGVEEDVVHKGGCHCGGVRFEVRCPRTLKCVNCNCSICTKKQNHHFIVPKHKFTLLCGEYGRVKSHLLTKLTFSHKIGV